MVKVALVNSGRKYYPSAQEPLNLGILASYLLKAGIEVRIIDQIAGHDVRKEIKKFNPDYVGITATTPTINNAYEIADCARKDGFKVIMGGKHVSALPEEALKHCDCVIIDEAENVLRNIVKEGIKQKIVEGIPLTDIENMPPLARNLLDMNYYIKNSALNVKSYLGYVNKKSRIASVITSRGCPYRCIFCYNSWRQSPVRFYTPEYVMKEIENLVNDYGVDTIFFYDDFLFSHKERIKKICSMIIEKGIKINWSCQIRANNVDPELIKLAMKAGCKELNFGFESGSQRILDILKCKTVTVEENRQAVKVCNSLGILPFGTFMIGNPTETEEDIRMTQKFIMENKIGGVGILFTTPYPATKIWDMYKHKIDLKNINWDEFTTGQYPVHMCDIPRDKLMNLFYETVNLSYRYNKFPLKRVVFDSMSHPIRTFGSVIKNPSKLAVLKNIMKRN